MAGAGSYLTPDGKQVRPFCKVGKQDESFPLFSEDGKQDNTNPLTVKDGKLLTQGNNGQKAGAGALGICKGYPNLTQHSNLTCL